jgi:hypothetical protein
VQTAKSALRKYVSGVGKPDWVGALPWILLGYRSSVQASTRMSPYFMLYGRHPIIPPASRQHWSEPIALDSSPPELIADLVADRAKRLKDHMVVAMSNLRIAQHRDTKNYARIRSGAYSKSVRIFHVGDFVWVRDPQTCNTLQIGVRPEVLRVVAVHKSGVLVLQGKCGRKTRRHSSQCAPCHLSGIDPSLDPLLAIIPPGHPCEVCNFADNEDLMLLCDACGTGWHTFCVHLQAVPPGRWTCPRCMTLGVTPQYLVERDRELGLLPEVPTVDLTSEE